MKTIIAHGPVIVENNELLVTKDTKDPFYKIPGGQPEDNETPEQTVLRELKEETGLDGKIIKKLSTQIFKKNPKTDEPMKIELNHYQTTLLNPSTHKTYSYQNHEVRWLPIDEIKQGKYNVAPNILFLIAKEEI